MYEVTMGKTFFFFKTKVPSKMKRNIFLELYRRYGSLQNDVPACYINNASSSQTKKYHNHRTIR